MALSRDPVFFWRNSGFLEKNGMLVLFRAPVKVSWQEGNLNLRILKTWLFAGCWLGGSSLSLGRSYNFLYTFYCDLRYIKD
jgi:hypothetical protein